MTTFAARLKLLMDEELLNPNQVARAAGLSNGTVYHYAHGTHAPTHAQAQLIGLAIEALGVRQACERLLLPSDDDRKAFEAARQARERD